MTHITRRVAHISFPSRPARPVMTWPWVFSITIAIIILGAFVSFFIDGVKL